MNLNGDYLSDALAAQVGGIGIAPGANINYVTGHAIFEATHGTAPKYADLDKVNPGSVILSGEMMFRYMGWTEVADLIVKGMEGAVAAKTVTYDFARLMDNATEVKCSEFGDAIIKTYGLVGESQSTAHAPHQVRGCFYKVVEVASDYSIISGQSEITRYAAGRVSRTPLNGARLDNFWLSASRWNSSISSRETLQGDCLLPSTFRAIPNYHNTSLQCGERHPISLVGHAWQQHKLINGHARHPRYVRSGRSAALRCLPPFPAAPLSASVLLAESGTACSLPNAAWCRSLYRSWICSSGSRERWSCTIFSITPVPTISRAS